MAIFSLKQWCSIVPLFSITPSYMGAIIAIFSILSDSIPSCSKNTLIEHQKADIVPLCSTIGLLFENRPALYFCNYKENKENNIRMLDTLFTEDFIDSMEQCFHF